MTSSNVKVMDIKGNITDKHTEMDFTTSEDSKRPANNSPNSPPSEKSRKTNSSPNHIDLKGYVWVPAFLEDSDDDDQEVKENINLSEFDAESSLDSKLDCLELYICKICHFKMTPFHDKEQLRLQFHIHYKLKHNSPCISYKNCSCLSFQNEVVYEFYPISKEPTL